MPKYLLKSWLIGLGISLVGFALMLPVHTPLAAIGMLISVPGMLGMVLPIELGQRTGLGDTAVSILSMISVPILGSIFYGALVFLVLRLRDRRKLHLTRPQRSPAPGG